MAKYFGVKCTFNMSESQTQGLDNFHFLSCNRFYVLPESEKIFQPKEGDSNEDYTFNGWKWIAKHDKLEWLEGKMPIEKRDGKQFFMPKIEINN